MYTLQSCSPFQRSSFLLTTMKASTAAKSSPIVKFKQDLQEQRLKSLALFTVPNTLSTSECGAFIKYAEDLGFSHQGSLGPAKGEAFRDNDRVSVQDSNLAENLWLSGLSKVFDNIKVDGKFASGLNPNIRFYRYKEGQRFGPHIDDNVDIERGRRTEYTLLIYLNGSGMKSKKSSSKGGKDTGQQLQGGETVFYPGHKRESIEAMIQLVCMRTPPPEAQLEASVVRRKGCVGSAIATTKGSYEGMFKFVYDFSTCGRLLELLILCSSVRKLENTSLVEVGEAQEGLNISMDTCILQEFTLLLVDVYHMRPSEDVHCVLPDLCENQDNCNLIQI